MSKRSRRKSNKKNHCHPQKISHQSEVSISTVKYNRSKFQRLLLSQSLKKSMFNSQSDMSNPKLALKKEFRCLAQFIIDQFISESWKRLLRNSILPIKILPITPLLMLWDPLNLIGPESRNLVTMILLTTSFHLLPTPLATHSRKMLLSGEDTTSSSSLQLSENTSTLMISIQESSVLLSSYQFWVLLQKCKPTLRDWLRIKKPMQMDFTTFDWISTVFGGMLQSITSCLLPMERLSELKASLITKVNSGLLWSKRPMPNLTADTMFSQGTLPDKTTWEIWLVLQFENTWPQIPTLLTSLEQPFRQDSQFLQFQNNKLLHWDSILIIRLLWSMPNQTEVLSSETVGVPLKKELSSQSARKVFSS